MVPNSKNKRKMRFTGRLQNDLRDSQKCAIFRVKEVSFDTWFAKVDCSWFGRRRVLHGQCFVRSPLAGQYGPDRLGRLDSPRFPNRHGNQHNCCPAHSASACPTCRQSRHRLAQTMPGMRQLCLTTGEVLWGVRIEGVGFRPNLRCHSSRITTFSHVC